jgi:hypothetical protein
MVSLLLPLTLRLVLLVLTQDQPDVSQCSSSEGSVSGGESSYGTAASSVSSLVSEARVPWGPSGEGWHVLALGTRDTEHGSGVGEEVAPELPLALTKYDFDTVNGIRVRMLPSVGNHYPSVLVSYRDLPGGDLLIDDFEHAMNPMEPWLPRNYQSSDSRYFWVDRPGWWEVSGFDGFLTVMAVCYVVLSGVCIYAYLLELLQEAEGYFAEEMEALRVYYEDPLFDGWPLSLSPWDLF